jgi:DNA-binding response OmpR family regulator
MKKSMLIVEDDPFTRKFLETYFKNGFEVNIVPNGMEALAWLQESSHPDLILADIHMPKLNGYSFLKEVRSSGFFRNIPVIMLSGVQSSKERIECLRLGANDIVSKPFNPEELSLRIQNLLSLKNA